MAKALLYPSGVLTYPRFALFPLWRWEATAQRYHAGRYETEASSSGWALSRRRAVAKRDEWLSSVGSDVLGDSTLALPPDV